MGLSDDQRSAIKASWEPVRANKTKVGVALMLTLFEKHPGYLEKFQALQAIPSAKLAEHPKLKAHGLTVVTMLTSWVDNLAETDVLVELVRKNALRHAGRGLKKKEFDSMWALIPGFLAEQLEELFDERTSDAWAAALPVLQSVTDGALQEHAQQHAAESPKGLTAEQVALIQKNWKVIFSKKTENGVDLFIRLFIAYPEFKDRFKQFQDVDNIEDLRHMAKMKAHGLTVMHALHSWMENLAEEDILVELVAKNANRHAGRGLTAKEFHQLWKLFPVFLSKNLGDAYTEESQAAWGQALQVLTAITDKALAEYQPA